MNTNLFRFSLRSARRLAIAALAAVVLLAVAGTFVLPPIAKSMVTERLSAALDREVTVGELRLNIFRLSAYASGIEVKERGGSGTLARLDSLYVNLQARSVLKGGVVIKELRLSGPHVRLVRNEDLLYNISDLIQPKKGEKKKDGRPFRFSVSNILVSGGSAEFVDLPNKTTHTVSDIELAVPFISNMGYVEEASVRPSFSAAVNGTPVSLEGRTKPFAGSLETVFDVTLKDIDLPHYLSYLPPGTRFGIPSGMLDLDMEVSYRQYGGGRAPELGVSGEATLKDLVVSDDKGREVLALSVLDVVLLSSDVLSGSYSLERVVVEEPQVEIERGPDGVFNLSRLLGRDGKEDAGEKKNEDGGALYLSVNLLKIARGRVSFTDLFNPEPFSTQLASVDVTALNFRNSPGWRTALSASFDTASGESLSLAAGVVVDPLTLNGVVRLVQVDLPRYQPYIPRKVLVEVTGGRLDLSTRFMYAPGGPDPERVLSELRLGLSGLRVKKKGEDYDLIKVAKTELSDTLLDLEARELTVGDVFTEDGRVELKRLRDGRVNFATLGAGGPADEGQEEDGAAAKPLVVTVKRGELSSFGLGFEDLSTPTPVRLSLEGIKASARDVSTAEGSAGRMALSFGIGRKGRFSSDGRVGVRPLKLDLEVALDKVELPPFEPYVAEKMNVVVKGGTLSLGGRFGLTGPPEGPTKFSYAGQASVNGLRTVDKAAGDDFLNWESLYLKGVETGSEPFRLSMSEVALTDFYSALIIREDGTINVRDIAVKTPEEKAPKEADKEPPQPGPKPSAAAVKIQRVTLQGGHVKFADRSIRPGFTADLTKLAGRVTGLSSQPDMLADVDLRAVYNDYAPIEIVGRINPLAENLFVDIKASFTDAELPPLTPYSGKYVGYTIRKGKLSLDLSYLIDGKKLDSTNKIFLDQFTLGDKVESPDATKLPVKFAIALLKDRNGEIHLDLPVTGRTDDPKFSIGALVWQVIKNILVKAATSPFALLGAIFGGGEELGYVEFDYGRDEIRPAEMKKLDKLVDTLYDRPALTLAIAGHADPEKDAPALREIAFQNMVKARKLEDMLDEGMERVPLEEVEVAPDEYEKYLEDAYDEADFPKPRNILGFAKSLPPEEMEKLMRSNIVIGEAELGGLAARRATGVKGYILATGRVEPQRVFTTQPQSLKPEEKDGVAGSRVEFILE